MEPAWVSPFKTIALVHKEDGLIPLYLLGPVLFDAIFYNEKWNVMVLWNLAGTAICRIHCTLYTA
jgi:hypothetical protein